MRVDVDKFEEKYRADRDPWRFASSRYEHHRYDVTMAHLGAARYERCFEPGCSVGVLTERLAAVCDSVVACDTSPTAVTSARIRLRKSTHVGLHVATLPEWWPSGSFDLVVLSEFGYYWDRMGLTDLAGRLQRSLRAGGELVAVHWLGYSPDHLLAGADVHEILAEVFGPSAEHAAEPFPRAPDAADVGPAGAGVAGAGLADSGLSGVGLSDSGLAGAGLSGVGVSDSGLAGSGLAGSGLAGAGLAGAGLAGADRARVDGGLRSGFVLDRWVMP